VVWSAEYLPFGEPVSVNEDVDGDGVVVTNNLRFPGQYQDQETELLQNWRREYMPQVGRYIEADPIGLGGGLNRYNYVNDNPVKFSDQSGLAYFAKRPLRGLSWQGLASCNPIDDFFNTEISHEQLFFEDGKNPSNIGFFEDGTLKEETNPVGYRCKSGEFNDCIMRKAVEEVPLRPYCLLGRPGKIDKFNCQDWPSEVRKKYDKLKVDCELKKGECCKR
jgi:RHS repeat-associated protein